MDITTHLYNEDGRAWDAFVANHQESTNYHQYGWRKVVEKSFGHRTMYLAATTRDNAICGILPFVRMKSRLFGSFLVSLPYFNYGGLLVCDDSVAATLLNASRKMLFGTGADHVELRHRTSCHDATVTKQHRTTMVLELKKNVEEQWRALDAGVRDEVREAKTNALQVVMGRAELLNGFYEVFCRNMRDLGMPVYGRNFFRNVLEEFPDTTKIISVTLKGRTIAASFLTWHKETLEVPWTCSNNDFEQMCPNSLLMWESIRYAIGLGTHRFDFGRLTPDKETDKFSTRWGAKPVQLSWQYLLREGDALPGETQARFKYQRLATQTWQRLPLMLTNFLGPYIVRCIP